MKFIRKNGRIIPIKEKGEESLAKGSYTRAVALRGAGGVATGVGLVSLITKKPPLSGSRLKFGAGMIAAGTALGVAGLANTIHGTYKEAKNNGGWSGFKRGLGLTAAGTVAGVAGGALAIPILKGSLKGAKGAQKVVNAFRAMKTQNVMKIVR